VSEQRTEIDSAAARLLPASPEQLARARVLILTRVVLSFAGLKLFFVRFELRFAGFEIFFARFQLIFVAREQNRKAMVLSGSPSDLIIEVERAKSGSGGIPREVGWSGDLYRRSWIYLGWNKVLLRRIKVL
jgi:hypothetical protein